VVRVVDWELVPMGQYPVQSSHVEIRAEVGAFGPTGPTRRKVDQVRDRSTIWFRRANGGPRDGEYGKAAP
jgi:hypothetical protein